MHFCFLREYDFQNADSFTLMIFFTAKLSVGVPYGSAQKILFGMACNYQDRLPLKFKKKMKKRVNFSMLTMGNDNLQNILEVANHREKRSKI